MTVTASSGALILKVTGARGRPGLSLEPGVFQQLGVGSVARPAEDKMREFVSVKDFGAVGNYADVPGAGHDDTDPIQMATDYCLEVGAKLWFPPGRYRTTAPIVIDRSANSDDPINGAMYGMTIQGGGSASSHICSDHTGACIDFRGGADAGWHTFFYIDGLGMSRTTQDQTGTAGLLIDQAALFAMQRFDLYGFDYGIKATDVLSSQVGSGRIAGNNHGYDFRRGTRSDPNAITMTGVTALNNIITGGTIERPGLFSIIGGSIESNGLGTAAHPLVLEDVDSWGLKVFDGGREAAVGINLSGVYFENNNGIADLWIAQGVPSPSPMHCVTGCSFLRQLNTRRTTNNILFNANEGARLFLAGNGFETKPIEDNQYVDDAARPFIAGADSVVINGGNSFRDIDGGTIGLRTSVFAPVNTYQSIPVASLPDADLYPSGIQYCPDGGGSGGPSLAVSDGATWKHLVLDRYSGTVSSAGAEIHLPDGWTVARNSAGNYTVTHNLDLGANVAALVATPKGAASGAGARACSGYAQSGNSFEIYFTDLAAAAAADTEFSFVLSRI